MLMHPENFVVSDTQSTSSALTGASNFTEKSSATVVPETTAPASMAQDKIRNNDPKF